MQASQSRIISSPIPTTRGRFYIRVVFSPWRWLVYLLWTAFCLLATIRDNFFSEQEQKEWATLRLLHKIPHLPWWAWTIGILLIALVFVLEASYREVRRRERTHESDVGKHQDALDSKDEEIARLTTKPDITGEILAVFWEPWRDPYSTAENVHSRYYIKLRLVNRNHVSCTIDEYRILVNSIYRNQPCQGKGMPSGVGKLRHPTSAYQDESTFTELRAADTMYDRTPKPPRGGPDSWTQTGSLDIPRYSPLERARKAEGWVTFTVGNYIPSPVRAEDIPARGYLAIAPWQQNITVIVVDSLGGEHLIEGEFVNVAPSTFSTD